MGMWDKKESKFNPLGGLKKMLQPKESTPAVNAPSKTLQPVSQEQSGNNVLRQQLSFGVGRQSAIYTQHPTNPNIGYLEYQVGDSANYVTREVTAIRNFMAGSNLRVQFTNNPTVNGNDAGNLHDYGTIHSATRPMSTPYEQWSVDNPVLANFAKESDTLQVQRESLYTGVQQSVQQPEQSHGYTFTSNSGHVFGLMQNPSKDPAKAGTYLMYSDLVKEPLEVRLNNSITKMQDGQKLSMTIVTAPNSCTLKAGDSYQPSMTQLSSFDGTKSEVWSFVQMDMERRERAKEATRQSRVQAAMGLDVHDNVAMQYQNTGSQFGQ